MGYFGGGGAATFSRQAVNLHQGNSILLIQPTGVWYCTFCMQNCHFIYFLLFFVIFCYLLLYSYFIYLFFICECYLAIFLLLFSLFRRSLDAGRRIDEPRSDASSGG